VSNLATIPQNASPTETAIRSALKSSLYPGATDESVDMVLSYCRAAALDPMTKPVHIVPIWIPEKRDGNRVVSPAGMRDVVMPGIELYRTKAHRTGEYAGQDEAQFGPDIVANLGGVQLTYPQWCKVTVYRTTAGQRVPYSAKVYWLEAYATAKRDTDAPNAMWKKRPYGQLEKCAEALALRKAFPEAVGAQPTAEEMEGKAHAESVDIQAQPAPRVTAIEHMPSYPEADFAANLPKWRDAIQSGKKTAADIVTMVQTKGRLTQSQIDQIHGRAADEPEPVEAELVEEGAAQ